MSEATDIVKQLLRRPVAFYPALAELAGSVTAGLFLSQAYYWSLKTDGDWFWKTREEWEQETLLTRSQQETARKTLCEAGLLQEELRGIPSKLFFRVDCGKLATLLAGNRHTGGGNPTSEDAENLPPIKEAETTTETTTETTSEILPPSGGKSVHNPDDQDQAIRWIFDYFVKTMEKTKAYILTKARYNMIHARLLEVMRMTDGDIERAANFIGRCIDAVTRSDWHMGKNPQTNGKAYNELENIFRPSNFSQWITAALHEEEDY